MAKKRLHNAPTETEILERYHHLMDEEEFAAMLAALRQPLPQAIRANPLKVDPGKAILEWARRYGWQAQPVPFCPTGWQILSAETPPSQTIEFRLGEYYIQDAASMLPAELLDFSGLEEPLVLDLAASPGGKTTHLVSRAGDRGLVLGNDSSPGRIPALRGVLRDWGGLHAAVTNFPGERFGGWYPETFDRALLDAPCSMENLRPAGGHARKVTSTRERQGLAQRQLRLLASAFLALKPGGQVVYSTCTLAPEEDEAVLDGLLKRYPGAVEVEELAGRLPHPAPALERDETQVFHLQVQRAARLWPHRFGTAGFFAALIRKIAPVETARQLPPARPLENVGWQRLSERDQAGQVAFFLDEYGLDLGVILEQQRLELWRRREGLHALPAAYFSWFAGLPVEGLGLLVGEETPQGFALSHEWAARFGRQFTGGVLLLADDQLAAWLRGEDIQGASQGFTAGSTVLVRDASGRTLGRGRVQGQRLKNLLPRRLL